MLSQGVVQLNLEQVRIVASARPHGAVDWS